MFQHLKTAVNEIISAAELVLRTPESISLLEQASELLDLASSAVDDPSIYKETIQLKFKIEAFIQVIVTEADFCDIQRCFQDMLNSCAIIEDICVEQSEEEPVIINQNHDDDHQHHHHDTSIPSSLITPNVSVQKNHAIEQEKTNLDIGPDALHCLQRQILGLDDDGDRQHLNEAGLTDYIDKVKTNKKTNDLNQYGGIGGGGNQIDQEDHNPLRLWPKLIKNAREFGQQNDNGTVQSLRMLGTENDDADMVGEMGQHLNGIIGSLEKFKDRKRALENAKRLPPFARRDAVVAIRKHLDEIKIQGNNSVEDLTFVLQNNVLSLLNENAMLLVCDTLESLAIAWQSHLTHSLNTSSSSSSSNISNHFERKSKEDSAMITDANECVIQEARDMVDKALSVIQANSRRRRVALATANMKLNTNIKNGGGGDDDDDLSLLSFKETPSNKSFDIYARDSCRKVGAAARDVGKQRKRNEIGSVHLSRHCSYEPTFNDVSGLAVATSQAKIEPSSFGKRGGLGGGGGGKLNTSSVFRAPPGVTKWKLSPDQDDETNQPRSYTKPSSSSLPPPRGSSSKVAMVSPQLF